MTKLELMRLSEYQDCEAVDYGDFELEELLEKVEVKSDAQRFKEKYKEFYTDIKISHREDW